MTNKLLNSRRNFIQQSSLASLGFLILKACKTQKKNPTILVISGWQDINIGDIAHTPGLLHILETFIPQANIILWKKSKSKEVETLLATRFPKVQIIHGKVDGEKNVDSSEVKGAFKQADIMIHGSGPYVVGLDNLEAWVKNTSKPFGIFGVTIADVNDTLKIILEKAFFIYTRETKSLEVLKEYGFSGNHISFAPDATFFLDLKNDEKASMFLADHGLEDNKFICAIPRLRYTPYHKIRETTNWSAEKINEVETTNAKHKEKDHAKMREAIIWWVRETGNKVLICPEMTYEVDIMDELLIDPLPKDVKSNVIKHAYWMPDEAASIYQKAFAILSFECHSPIISLANNTPAFYLRQPEDTIKGQMYYDLGFEDWVFEIEETMGEDVVKELQLVWQNYPKAQEKVKKTMKSIDEIYKKDCLQIEQSIL